METYLIFSIILLIYILLSNSLQKKKNKYYTDASLATIMGLFIAYFINFDDMEKNDLFLELVLPIIIMGAAQEVDLKLFYRNSNYILLYGIFGTFFNFLGLFCFLFLFYEVFNLKILNGSNCLIKSIIIISNINSNRYSFSFNINKKKKISQSPLNNFRRRITK